MVFRFSLRIETFLFRQNLRENANLCETQPASYQLNIQSSLLCLFVPFLSLFFLRETESTRGGGTEGEGRERIPTRLRTVSAEPDVGLELTN